MTKLTTSVVSLILGLTISSNCFAHPGHVTSSSFWTGFLHPLTGLDHLAALVFIGIFAFICDKDTSVRLIISVGLSLFAGFLIGVEWVHASAAESLVAMSMIMLPICLIAYRFVGALKSLALIAVGVFSLCHGLVQGAEVQGMLVAYAVGTMLSSVLIIILTLCVSHLCKVAVNTFKVA